MIQIFDEFDKYGSTDFFDQKNLTLRYLDIRFLLLAYQVCESWYPLCFMGKPLNINC